MKILSLDLGDQWTGTAISDTLGLLAKPYKTIKTSELEVFLQTFLIQENIATVVIGLPITLKGTESQQTKKTRAYKDLLQERFSSVTWLFWDERLTSKQAEQLKKISNKEEKIQAHSKAAALILQNYLEYLYIKNTPRA